MERERRRAPRYPLIADAEVTEIASNTKLKARTVDVNWHGCFLEMLNPMPQGSRIQLTLFHRGQRFNAAGTVVFVAPNLGVGVAFTQVSAVDLDVIGNWLSELILAAKS